MKNKTYLIPVLILVVAGAVYLVIGQLNRFARTTGKSVIERGNNSTTVQAGSAGESFDACALISSEEIQAVQGETVKTAKNTSRTSGSFFVSQCFYELPTYSKSISLEVTRSSSEDSELRHLWEEKFNSQATSEEEDEREEEQENKKDKSGENETNERLQAVPNLGASAFRVGNRISNALYVLTDNAILRISVGGAEDEKTKLQKLKNLAQKALDRMH